MDLTGGNSNTNNGPPPLRPTSSPPLIPMRKPPTHSPTLSPPPPPTATQSTLLPPTPPSASSIQQPNIEEQPAVHDNPLMGANITDVNNHLKHMSNGNDNKTNFQEDLPSNNDNLAMIQNVKASASKFISSKVSSDKHQPNAIRKLQTWRTRPYLEVFSYMHLHPRTLDSVFKGGLMNLQNSLGYLKKVKILSLSLSLSLSPFFLKHFLTDI